MSVERMFDHDLLLVDILAFAPACFLTVAKQSKISPAALSVAKQGGKIRAGVKVMISTDNYEARRRRPPKI